MLFVWVDSQSGPDFPGQPPERFARTVAREVTARLKVGPPGAGDTRLGPVVNLRQWLRIQDYIQGGIDAGATLVAGGTGRPPGLGRGHYVQPTVFAHVHKDMSIARDEITPTISSSMR